VPRWPGAALLFLPLRRAFLCKTGAWPLGACSPPLAALRDSLDRDPAARPVPGPLDVRKRRRHRHPVPVRALGPRGRGRHGHWHPPGGLNTPHPQDGGTNLCNPIPTLARRLRQARGAREGGGEIRPAGGRSHGAGACGSRAGVARWGFAGAVSGEQRGAPPWDVLARSHAKAGRRAALDAQPERPLIARGARTKCLTQ
jgi:hypothetical protein